MKSRKSTWGLRLLALVLAIVIYHVLKNETVRPGHDNERHLFHYR